MFGGSSLHRSWVRCGFIAVDSVLAFIIAFESLECSKLMVDMMAHHREIEQGH